MRSLLIVAPSALNEPSRHVRQYILLAFSFSFFTDQPLTTPPSIPSSATHRPPHLAAINPPLRRTCKSAAHRPAGLYTGFLWGSTCEFPSSPLFSFFPSGFMCSEFHPHNDGVTLQPYCPVAPRPVTLLRCHPGAPSPVARTSSSGLGLCAPRQFLHV
jgi:hypothetical protein